MNDSTRNKGFGGGSASQADSTDYRIREVEARLDRRLSSVESKGGSGWVGRLMGVGLVATWIGMALILWRVTPADGAWAMDSLSTEEVVLRDADGIERGRLATDEDGRAQLTLSDQQGQERIRLTVLADGSPGVTISDPDSRPRAVLGYLPDGTTNLVFADAQGTSRAVLGVEPDGSTQALFADQSGTIRTLVGVGPDGVPSVSVFEGGDSAP